MTTILEPSFETINGWTYTQNSGEGWTYNGSQTITWKSDGSYSYLFKSIGIPGSPPPRMVLGDYMQLSRIVNFDSNFILRFDYNVDTYSGDPSWKLRIKIDNTIIETINLHDGVYLNHDTPIIGYTGNHTLTIEFYYPLEFGWHLYDWNFYIDNLRVIETTDPCYGITCPDICIGTDLWTQTCVPKDSTYECLPNTIKETNNIVCDEYTLYYKVPSIYPTWYVNSVLPFVQSLGDNTLSSYPDYYVASRTYNGTNKILEINIKRKPLQTLIGFAAVALAIVALELLIGIAIFLYGIQYMGAIRGKGVASTTRSVIITPGKCTPTCIAMSVPVTIEYKIEGIAYTETIPVGTLSKTITIPNNIDINFTAKAEGYICKNKILICEAGIGQCDLNIEFAPVENSDATIVPKDDNGNPVTCGSYQITLVDSNIELAYGQLIEGKTSKITFPADELIAATIVPCDMTNFKPNTVIFKLSAGQTMEIENIISTCEKAKNSLSIMSQYTAEDGSLTGFTPDSITISTSGYTKTYTKGIDYKSPDYVYVIKGLEINKTYNISIKSNYIISTISQPTPFTTDCFATTQIFVKASTPLNSRDFIISVVDSDTTNAVINADVFLDSATIGVPTNTLGNTTTFIGIPYGKHTVKIIKAGYDNTTSQIDVSSTSLAQYIIKMKPTGSSGNIVTSIFNLINKDDLYSKNLVQFEGYLKYLDTDLTYKPIVSADISVNVMDGTTIIKSFNITSEDFPSIFLGRFVTPEWEIPPSLAKKNIDVIAKYEGSGDLKATSYTQSFYIDEGCCLNLPFIGCIASQNTCNTIKNVVIGGGILIGGYVVYKLVSSKK